MPSPPELPMDLNNVPPYTENDEEEEELEAYDDDESFSQQSEPPSTFLTTNLSANSPNLLPPFHTHKPRRMILISIGRSTTLQPLQTQNMSSLTHTVMTL
jgi:hypothetical protein